MRYSCCKAPEEHKGYSLEQDHVYRSSMPGYNGPLEVYIYEMIYTAVGMELAHVVLANTFGDPVQNALVKPSATVLIATQFFMVFIWKKYHPP